MIYGLVAGLTGLLPVSFSGHAAVLQDAFALSPLTQGAGTVHQAAITLGLQRCARAGFPRRAAADLRELARRPQRENAPGSRLHAAARRPDGPACSPDRSAEPESGAQRQAHHAPVAHRRVLLPERPLSCLLPGRPGGQKDARALMLPDALLAGATRLAAVLPACRRSA